MPLRRTVRRSAAAVSPDRSSLIAELSNLDPKNPALPNIPTKTSFAYGSQATAILPRQLVVQEKMDLTEMAATIERGRIEAEDRERQEALEAERFTRRKRSITPVKKREPTPDQIQLLDTLQEDIQSASASPEPGRSTPTPTPPIPHTLSTTSGSVTHSPRQNGLYPSSLFHPGLVNGLGTPLGSSPLQSSMDNDSTINSWTVERDVHEDDLKRTHPGRGRNISAPPRRISGLALIHETIEEEPPAPQPEPEPEHESEPEPEPELEPELEPEPEPESEPEPEPEAKPVVEPPPAPPATVVRQSRARRQSPVKVEVAVPRLNLFFRIATIALLTTLSCLALYTYGERLAQLSRGVCSFPFGGQPRVWNASDPNVVNLLTKEVDELNSQILALSKDLKGVKSELANTIFDNNARPIPGHKAKSKINFLSYGTGPIVDPNRTTPTAGKKPNWFQRVYFWVFGGRKENSPATVFLPWNDVGDCWCSTPRNGMVQLAVSLGRQIVPASVEIEHIPHEATLMPDVAPRRMELWAQYWGEVPDSPSASLFSWFPRWLSIIPSRLQPEKIPTSSSPTPYSYSLSGKFLLHETIMGVLRKVYEKEPETSYSTDAAGDEYMGKGFYRLGRWEYNLHGRDYAQEFPLEAIVDLPGIRVNKVVFRVTSNWGGNVTCIYQVKLFGSV